MHIAILTFDGFNELDSLIALGILNRVKRPGWKVSIACPAARVTSMNGIVIEAQATLEDASRADAVIVGSGMKTREVVADTGLMSELRLDPSRQLLAAQCSGTLVLAKLGLLDGVAACTDLTTRPWVVEAGVDVLNQPFVRKRQRRHGRWLPRVAISRRLGDCAAGGHRGSVRRDVLRRPGRREGRVRVAGDAEHHALP
nr:Putative amidotransferase [uncultured bacterium]